MAQNTKRDLCCSETVLFDVNHEIGLEGFTPSCIRIASAFCGGIGGMGETCGAVTGAAMCLGLSLGTDGTEDGSVLKSKREATEKSGKGYSPTFL